MGGVRPMSENRENQYLLYFEDVYKRYHDRKGKEFTVLNDIDLKVTAGEFITLVGPSGCGKSTLLRLIMGSEQPNQGTVMFDGEPAPSPNRDRGIVFQKYSLAACIKACLKIQGFPVGNPVPPMQPLTGSALNEVRTVLEELDLSRPTK